MLWDQGKSFEILENRYFQTTDNPPECRALFERTAVNLCKHIMQDMGPPYWFTSHGLGHSDRVIEYALCIAKRTDDYLGHLKPLEAMALACSCYLHDLAMAHLPQTIDLSNGWSPQLVDMVRQWHVSGIEHVLNLHQSSLGDLYAWDARLEELLPAICLGHGTQFHSEACERLVGISPAECRGDLVAKILLVADELDLTARRSAIDRKHPQFGAFPQAAKAHQFKHHYIVGVAVDPPRVKVEFAFAEDMTEEQKRLFLEWTFCKLHAQVALVNKGMPKQYRNAFDLQFEPTVATGIGRQPCPECICEAIKAEMAHSPKSARRREQTLGRARASDYYPERHRSRALGTLYPLLDYLMDEFFRECTTPRALKLFSRAYVTVPQNASIGDNLVHCLSEHCLEVRKAQWGASPASHPFVMTGGTGVGKSALLLYLQAKGALKSVVGRGTQDRIVAFLDCLGYGSFDEVLRALILEILKECRRCKELAAQLQSEHLNMRGAEIAMLPPANARDVLRCMIDTIQGATGHMGTRYPVCVVLDNLDRIPGGFPAQLETVRFVLAESSGGRGFFVLPLRYSTKRRIDIECDDLPAIATHDISAPAPSDVLVARLRVAFSKRILKGESAWWRPTTATAILERTSLTFEKLQEALKTAVETLCHPDEHRAGLVPALSGTNTRFALTLFRAIIKSVEPEELARMSRGMYREHYLIRCLALERAPYYRSGSSKIRNLFDPSVNGYYLSQLYLLNLLWSLQHGEYGENWVSYNRWRSDATQRVGLSDEAFRKGLWDLATRDLSLVTVQGADDSLPTEQYQRVEDLVEEEFVLSPAGQYYLHSLIHDLAYLWCVQQDTEVDEALARELSSTDDAIEQVETFLRFLGRQEDAERSAWQTSPDIPKIVPRIKERFRPQKTAMLERSVK